MARMKYVQRRANRFEFRFPLPDDLAGRAHPHPWPERLAAAVNPRTQRFKTEIIRSLRTTDSRVAERAALPLIEEMHRLVDLCRKSLTEGPPSELPAELIAELAQDQERALLKADEELRMRGVGSTSPEGSGCQTDSA